MSDLDDFSGLKNLDPRNVLGEMEGLPDPLKAARELGRTLPLAGAGNIQRIVIAQCRCPWLKLLSSA